MLYLSLFQIGVIWVLASPIFELYNPNEGKINVPDIIFRPAAIAMVSWAVAMFGAIWGAQLLYIDEASVFII